MGLRARPIGRWFDLDAEGFIVNPAAWERVPAPVRPVVARVGGVYRRHFGAALHSVYVRGSIVTGGAVRGFADLDTFALVRSDPAEGHVRWWEPPWAEPESQRLGTAAGWLTGTDFAKASYHDDLDAHNATLAAAIVTQALCVAGADIGPRLRPRRPGPDMFLDYLRVGDAVAALEAIALERTPSDVERLRAALKRLLRVGFELVMEREGRYTTSVYLACESFGAHHPEHRDSMRRVLELYLEQEADRELPLGAIVELLPLARWLADAAGRLAPPSGMVSSRA